MDCVVTRLRLSFQTLGQGRTVFTWVSEDGRDTKGYRNEKVSPVLPLLVSDVKVFRIVTVFAKHGG